MRRRDVNHVSTFKNFSGCRDRSCHRVGILQRWFWRRTAIWISVPACGSRAGYPRNAGIRFSSYENDDQNNNGDKSVNAPIGEEFTLLLHLLHSLATLSRYNKD